MEGSETVAVVPSESWRHRPIKVEVHALLSNGTSQLPTASSSSKSSNEHCLASKGLWNQLEAERRRLRGHSTHINGNDAESGWNDLDEVIGIAVELPTDRRLNRKGKGRALVVWVERDDRGNEEKDVNRLYVPHHLLPPYPSTPLHALLHLHDPCELSLVILQPALSAETLSDSAILDLDDFDISQCYGHPLTNGTSSKDSHLPTPRRFFRQGDLVDLPRTNGSSQLCKILICEPVDQGVISRTTRVIVTSQPFVVDSVDDTSWPDDAASASSHSRSHTSLVDFDPDAFLSSNLNFQTRHDALPNGDLGPDRADSSRSTESSTSGSITPRPGFLTPESQPAAVEDLMEEGEAETGRGPRFNAVRALGPSLSGVDGEGTEVVWMGIHGLGQAGIFEGDWVLLKPVTDSASGSAGRLVRVVAWEKLDEDDPEIPEDPILLPPMLYRSFFVEEYVKDNLELTVTPTPFGSRSPTLPIARTMTLVRIATAEGVDKRYERSWLQGIKVAFRKGGNGAESKTLLRRGDVVSTPIWTDTPLAPDEDPSSDSESEEFETVDHQEWQRQVPSALAYFMVTALSFDSLVPLDEDFAASVTSKARAGELGCWIDVGKNGTTRLVLNGLERARVSSRAIDQSYRGIDMPSRPPFASSMARLRDLLSVSLASPTTASNLSILLTGGRGAGKSTLVRYVADDLGFNVITLEGYDLAGESMTKLSGTVLASMDKATACAPSILLIRHIEALAKKTESTVLGSSPPIVRVLDDLNDKRLKIARETGFPCVLIGTAVDPEQLPSGLLSCFHQEMTLTAPNEDERLFILEELLESVSVMPDVSTSSIAAQTAALLPGDLAALSAQVKDLALARAVQASSRSLQDVILAGVSISKSDFDKAISSARASYSDSIGAPKIPNVSWDDVGGLAAIKQEILETVQLPLEHPELFAKGLKKRSGILLYGPPGTGKTLLAKAVATSCSLNFFSVKGPELLNMYIGESEANVRRIFQRARDASPCIIFMDELDSIAPKRGNQGDSGGVMDRIVSQLLAELDGMSSGDSSDVFVMGATNRPDLLDPALLRPGRFDRMLYLSVPTTHSAQLSIIQALTRKFDLDPKLELEEIAEQCPFNYTGADFYALCSDAMLRAMTRKAEMVEVEVARLNKTDLPLGTPNPLTAQYYLASMAHREELQVQVGKEDFEEALKRLVPSVSTGEMLHYEQVQGEFKGYEIGRQDEVD